MCLNYITSQILSHVIIQEFSHLLCLFFILLGVGCYCKVFKYDRKQACCSVCSYLFLNKKNSPSFVDFVVTL